ncbi:MAG TPA: DUF952 domain-containing protein [Burkholderiales bacterium]|nr:DUF952 domain-containing protein [Burkholderiales bacterium]
MSAFVFKILRRVEWEAARQRGVLSACGDDLRDGFIHLSTHEQLEGTLTKHFAGEAGLVLLQIQTAAVSSALKWERSRGGALFPHLYADLPLRAVNRTFGITMTESGEHMLPPELRRSP